MKCENMNFSEVPTQVTTHTEPWIIKDSRDALFLQAQYLSPPSSPHLVLKAALL